MTSLKRILTAAATSVLMAASIGAVPATAQESDNHYGMVVFLKGSEFFNCCRHGGRNDRTSWAG
jgi:ribose transport system substrate-binding protein